MINIYSALKKIPFDKQEYFKYKFPDIRFDKTLPEKTEEEFLKVVGKKTMNTYYRWEKSDEYKALVALYLQSKTANDLVDVYSAVVNNAQKGDDKSVKLLLLLQKEINEHAKQANKAFTVDEEKEEDDELEI